MLGKEVRPLYERLEADGDDSRYRLGRMSNESLRQVVTNPLQLGGRDVTERESLADLVLRDVGQRPVTKALER